MNTLTYRLSMEIPFLPHLETKMSSRRRRRRWTDR